MVVLFEKFLILPLMLRIKELPTKNHQTKDELLKHQKNLPIVILVFYLLINLLILLP